MLFVTNRVFEQGSKTKIGRKVTFADSNLASAALFFCERAGAGDYTEVGRLAFFTTLRDSKADQLLFYLHGFNNLPEKDIFPRAETLQAMCDALCTVHKIGRIEVVPLIWPCDDDFGVVEDYFDDQHAADQSAFAFARLLFKFNQWREEEVRRVAAAGGTQAGGGAKADALCLKRLNLVAHSMGNRVLRGALGNWHDDFRKVAYLFRNVFMAAADVVNETLEKDKPGRHICDAARNVVVYHAADDLALQASKVANVRNKIVSRRLGHTGPEDMGRVPQNVYAVDCDGINGRYDKLAGHAYFLDDPDEGTPGLVFQHMFAAMRTGRVAVSDSLRRTHVIMPLAPDSAAEFIDHGG